MTANDRQVGGTHYKSKQEGMPEHWDIVIYMGWDYLVGNATKYLWRLGKKNGSWQGQLEDVEKAIHYLEKKRDLLRKECKLPPKKTTTAFSDPINDPEEDD